MTPLAQAGQTNLHLSERSPLLYQFNCLFYEHHILHFWAHLNFSKQAEQAGRMLYLHIKIQQCVFSILR